MFEICLLHSVQKKGGTAWEIKDLFLLSYINKNNRQTLVNIFYVVLLSCMLSSPWQTGLLRRLWQLWVPGIQYTVYTYHGGQLFLSLKLSQILTHSPAS